MTKKVLFFILLQLAGAGSLQAHDFRSEFQTGNAVEEPDTSFREWSGGKSIETGLDSGFSESAPESALFQTGETGTLAWNQPLDTPLRLDSPDSPSRRKYKQKLPELSADSIRTRKRQRGLTSMSNMFVPQGQWVTGINASFSAHSNDHYTFVVVEGIESEGYSVNVSPFLGYAFRNNMVIGARFVYSRTFQSIDNGSIQLGDEDTGIDLKIDTFYSIKHTYQASFVWRQYIPLGSSKRFALFNEMQLAMGSSQAKFAEGTPVRGTYETGQHFSLGITPGLVAFATNNMAIELNVGIMGITYSKVRQIHNQVTVGTRKSSMMNFKVNIFSIGIGVAFYL